MGGLILKGEVVGGLILEGEVECICERRRGDHEHCSSLSALELLNEDS